MPKRIQRKRTKGWRMPEGAVYVGRPSIWGNHYPVTYGPGAWLASIPGGDAGFTSERAARQASVDSYRDLIARVSTSSVDPLMLHDGLGVWDRDIYQTIRTRLAGKDLACWCPLDLPCHADVLLAIANGPD